MITDSMHAKAVQTKRRLSGKKGRSKAVRRWFKRTYGRAVEAHPPSLLPVGLVDSLCGEFKGCTLPPQGARQTERPDDAVDCLVCRGSKISAGGTCQWCEGTGWDKETTERIRRENARYGGRKP